MVFIEFYEKNVGNNIRLLICCLLFFMRAFSLSAATELPQTQPVGLCFLSSVCFLGVYLRASLAFRVIIAKIVAMIVAMLLHKTMMKNVR